LVRLFKIPTTDTRSPPIYTISALAATTSILPSAARAMVTIAASNHRQS
jgi:hypothetical protein